MKIFKTIIKAAGILLVLLVLAAVIFIATFDANKYKPEIIAQVEQTTGRNFSIDGDIGLTFYPWIGIKLGKTTLGNAKGFSHQPFASIDQLNVKVNVLPLLKKKIEINKIQLHGMNLSLEVDKQGNNNWSNLMQRKQAAVTTPTPTQAAAKAPQSAVSTGSKTSPGLALQSLAIAGFEFVDASINYTDEKTGMQAKIAGLNLETGGIQFDQPVKLKLSARVSDNKPVINSKIHLTTSLTFNHDFSLFTLRDLLLNVAVKANEMIKQDMTLKLSTQAKIDMAQQQVSISKLKLTALGVNTGADVLITRFMSTPEIKAHISVKSFNIHALTEKLGIKLPLMTNKQALNTVSLTSSLKLVKQSLALDNINMHLDKSVLTGWVHVLNLAKQSLRYHLLLNQIDLNDYLPPVARNAPATTTTRPSGAAAASAVGTTASADEKIALPMDMLRTLDVKGVFAINAIHIQTYDMKAFSATTKATHGLIKVDPITLKMSGGTINAGVSLNVKHKPHYALNLKVSNMQAGPLVNPSLKGLMGEKPLHLQGAINATAAVTTRGESLNAYKRQAKGRITLDMKQTRVTGFDPEYYVRSSIANYLQAKGLSSVANVRGYYKPRKVTVFNTIHDTARINHGKIKTSNFLMRSDRITIKAHGSSDIMKNTVDMISSIQLSRNKTVLEKLLKKPLFVHIHGPFEQLKYDIDTKKLSTNVNSLIKEEAKARLKKRLDKEKQKLRKKLDNRRKKLENNLKEKLRNKLRSFF